jgi:hypothetical protein
MALAAMVRRRGAPTRLSLVGALHPPLHGKDAAALGRTWLGSGHGCIMDAPVHGNTEVSFRFAG